jgi:hypothetical protein
MEPNTILWDQEVRGFVARRQRSDIVTFSVVYRTREGTQRWQKLERFPILTPHIARQEAIRVLPLGQDPAGERYALRSGATMGELCADFLADMQSAKINGKKSSTIKSDKSRIENHIQGRLGKFRIASISQDQIEAFINSMSQGSAGRILALLSSMFTFAIKKGLRSDNPCKGVTKPKDIRRTKRLSEIEYAELGAKLNSNVTNQTALDIIRFLLVTGWRSG